VVVLVRAHTTGYGSGGSSKPLASLCCRGIRGNISGVVHLPFSYIQRNIIDHPPATRESMKRGAGRWVEIRLTIIRGFVPKLYQRGFIDY